MTACKAERYVCNVSQCRQCQSVTTVTIYVSITVSRIAVTAVKVLSAGIITGPSIRTWRATSRHLKCNVTGKHFGYHTRIQWECAGAYGTSATGKDQSRKTKILYSCIIVTWWSGSRGIQAWSWRPAGFLQSFDTVGLVIWPVKIIPEMTYYVSSGTLSLYTTTTTTAVSNPAFSSPLLFHWQTLLEFRSCRRCETLSTGWAIKRLFFESL